LDDHYYYSQDFENFSEIGSGGSASVHVICWKNTQIKFAIKKFNEGSKEEIINEIKIMRMASHPTIIKFYGVTKLQDESNYSLVLEYADGGTLEKHLRDNARTLIKWESQLKFAKEITGAVLWLHVNKIIHGDLHPKNILIHQNTLKLTDFGCSRLQGDKEFTKPRGIIPYMDPKNLNAGSCDLTKKSDIYSLGVVFWELTSCSSPFDFETKNNDRFEIFNIKSDILKGIRENPVPNTNDKFVKLYENCWQHEPDDRPDICKVNTELNSMTQSNQNFLINFENNNESNSFDSKESETIEKLENENSDSSSFEDCDILSDKYQL